MPVLQFKGKTATREGWQMKMKSIISQAVLLFTIVFLNSPSSAQTAKLAAAYGALSADQLVLWVAKDAGIFARNNLDVQLIFFTGGALAVMAMVSGDTPIIQASGPAIVSAGLAGADGVYVAGGIVSLDYQLMTLPEIKTPEQLKGGSVAIARFGWAADFVARFALSKIGLNPLKDVTNGQPSPCTARCIGERRGPSRSLRRHSSRVGSGPPPPSHAASTGHSLGGEA